MVINEKSIGNLQRDFPYKLEKLEEVSYNYRSANDLKILKTEIPEKWKFFDKKLAYPYECFNSINDYQKPENKFEKENHFGKFKNACPSDEKIEKRNQIFNLLKIKNKEELTKLYLQSDIILLTCVLTKFL